MDAELAYLFRHALIRSAAYELQLPSERARLHRLVLELCEALLGQPGKPESLDPFALELADHARLAQAALLQAANSATRRQEEILLGRKEACYLERAGLWARRNHRPVERRQCQTRLIEHAAATPTQKANALLELAEALRDLGEGRTALELVRRALREGVKLGLDETAGRSLLALAILSEGRGQLAKARRLYARAKNRLERCGYTRGLALAITYCAELKNRMGQVAECEADIARALELAASCDPAVRAGVLLQLALIRGTQGRSAEAEELYRSLLALAAGSGEVTSGALVNYASLLADMGRPVEAGGLLEQSLAAALAVGDRVRESSVRGEYARHLQNQGQLDAAEAQYHLALDVAQEIGNEAGESTLRQNLASLHMDRGRVLESEREYRAALVLHTRLGKVSGQGFCLCCIALCRQQVGDFAEAERLYHQGLALIRSVAAGRYEGMFLGYLGDLYAETSRPQQALQAYEQALALHRAAGYLRYEAVVLGNLGRLRFRQGEVQAGVALLEQSVARAEQGHELVVGGAARGELAACLLLLGKGDDACRLARAAESALREAGCVGTALECAAVVLRCRLDEGADVMPELESLEAQAGALSDPAPAARLAEVRSCLQAARRGEGLFRGHLRAELSPALLAALGQP